MIIIKHAIALAILSALTLLLHTLEAAFVIFQAEKAVVEKKDGNGKMIFVNSWFHYIPVSPKQGN